MAALASLCAAGAVRLESKEQWEALVSDRSSPWLVLFHQIELPLSPPADDDDARESAWFVKLCAVWGEVREGRIPWASRSRSPLSCATLDKRQPWLSLVSEAFSSEVSSVSSTVRLIDRGEDRGGAPVEMESRKTMHVVLQWVDAQLARKVEL